MKSWWVAVAAACAFGCADAAAESAAGAVAGSAAPEFDLPIPEILAPHDEAAEVPEAAETDGPMTPAAWSPFCSNCERARDQLKEDLKQEIGAHEAFKRASSVFRNSFGYIRIDWVKTALYNGGYYDEGAVRSDGYDDVIKSLDYNRQTIEAAKEFQCAYYRETPKSAKKDCDTPLTTGWLTFLESRSAICEQGWRGEDETAYILAEWYAYGRVFEQDLGVAHSLLTRYREALAAKIARETRVDQKDFLKRLNNDARALLQFVDRMVQDRVKTAGRPLTGAEIDAIRGTGVTYDIKVICPRDA